MWNTQIHHPASHNRASLKTVPDTVHTSRRTSETSEVNRASFGFRRTTQNTDQGSQTHFTRWPPKVESG